MEKKSLLTLCIIMLLNIAALAQVYIGEAPASEVKSKKADKPEKTRPGKRKDKFLQFAYINSKMNPITTYEFGPFKPGTNSTLGFMLEKGAMRFFSDNFMLKDKGNIGVYSSIGIGVQFRDFALPAYFKGVKIPFIMADLKLGPDIRFKVTDKLKFDLYGNIGGLINIGGVVVAEDESILYEPKKPSIGLQTGVGLNVVLSGIYIGAQYTFAKGKFKFNITEDPNLYNSPVPEDEVFDYKVSLNSFRIYFGFYFH